MTDDSTLRELPRVSRDIAVTSQSRRTGAGPRTFGVLPPFSGLLDRRVDRGTPPLPDLSYLTLAPLVAAAHRGGRRGSASTGGADRTPGDSPATGDSSGGDDAEPTVREVLDRTATSRDPAGGDADAPDLDRTLAERTAVEEQSPSRPVRTSTGDEPTDRSEGPDATRRSRDPGQSSHDADSRPNSADPNGERRRSVDRTVRRTQSGSGPSVAGERGDDVSRDRQTRRPTSVAPPEMTLPAATAPTESPDDSATSRLRRQPDAWPSASARPTPDRGSDAARDGPRLTVRSADDDGATGRGGSDGDDGPGTGDATAGGRDEATGASATRSDTGDLSRVLAASADPESRLVDRLYRALSEREAIERRRRGGR